MTFSIATSWEPTAFSNVPVNVPRSFFAHRSRTTALVPGKRPTSSHRNDRTPSSVPRLKRMTAFDPSAAPGSARAHQLLGQSYEAQGKKAEAEAELKAAFEAGPPTAGVLVALGDLRRSQLDFAEARTYYTRAIELAPELVDPGASPWP